MKRDRIKSTRAARSFRPPDGLKRVRTRTPLTAGSAATCPFFASTDSELPGAVARIRKAGVDPEVMLNSIDRATLTTTPGKCYADAAWGHAGSSARRFSDQLQHAVSLY